VAEAEEAAEPAAHTEPVGGVLGLWPALGLVAGSMLGVGVFIGPPVVAQHIQQPSAFMLLWLAGGIAALAGAMSLAELGAMMPRTGGDYPYLRLAYGPGIAFAVGWLQILVVFPGSLATITVGTSSFQLPVLLGSFYDAPIAISGLPITPATFWTAVILISLTAINHVGILLSGRLQLLLTVIPISVLFAACVYQLLVSGTTEPKHAAAAPAAIALSGIAAAYLPVYFAYSGWYAALFVGGEVRSPARTLPIALIAGTVSIVMLYAVLCAGFMTVFTLPELAETGEVGTAAARVIFGEAGALSITFLICIAMLGSVNGTVMTGARITVAMARQHDLPAIAGSHDDRFHSPTIALWLQTAIALALISTHRFEELMNYTTSAMLITGSLTVLSVVVLRRRLPELDRPYRLPAYPLPPVVYVASTLFALGILASNLDSSVWMAIGWFVFALALHKLLALSRSRKAGD
jgi:APA family basic amino acid/polyamine antiporter